MAVRGWPRWTVIVLAVLVVVVGAAAGAVAWATTYDRRMSDTLLPGTVIQGVDVGGMRAADAVSLLRERIEGPLHRPVELRSSGFQATTTPWELGLRVDVGAAVRKAQGHAGGSVVTRVWKRLFTQPQRLVAAAPRWHEGDLDAALERIAGEVYTPPVDAAADGSSGWVTITPGSAGIELDKERSREAVRDGVALFDPVVSLPTRKVAPAVDRDAFRQVVLVRTGENRLYLYRNGVIAKDWPVATGSASYATPTGTWKIVEKIVNPTWYNPGSAWAAGMPARIGPGPHNPLGTLALALDAPGILIHATPDRSSIGFNVSHGCIRMLTEHEQELFDQVEEGTPVVVVNAGTPQPRVTEPTVADPVQAAAVQF